MTKILIIAGGGTNHMMPFAEAAKSLDMEVMIASFDDMTYVTNESGFILKIKDTPLSDFSGIYIRLVGKRFEEAAIVVDEARKLGIKIIDKIYEESKFIRLPMPKGLEVKTFAQNGIPTPKSFFGNLAEIAKVCPEIFGYPFVIKGTTGKQGHAVWSPRSKEEMNELITKTLSKKEELGMRFVAQEFIAASQRSRVFVIGETAVAAITRPTRWRKRFIDKIDGQFPEGQRTALNPIPVDQAELAVRASKVLGITVGGVDVIKEDKTDKLYILEVNSAPRWESIKKDTGINVEEKILIYLKGIL